MRQTAPSSPRRRAILLLAALMASLALPCFAQAPASAADASFVASLAAPAATTAPALQPAPIFLQTSSGCTTNADCPNGQLCCLACGYFGCMHKACFKTTNGCPHFP